MTKSNPVNALRQQQTQRANVEDTQVKSAAAKSAAGNKAKLTETAAAVEASIATKMEALKLHCANLWNKLRPGPVAQPIIKVVAMIALYALGFASSIYVAGWLSMAMYTGGVPLLLAAAFEIFAIIIGCLASWLAAEKIVGFVADGGIGRTITNVGGWLKSKLPSLSKTERAQA